MKMRIALLFLAIAVSSATFCQTAFDIEGHRGCRGLLPENTIPAFINAVKLGVNTLEMDMQISKDGKIVISHDAFMGSNICSTPDGKPVISADEEKLKIYTLTYDEIKKYDCGSRGNAKFPEQQKMATYKPLLSEVIDSVEKYIAEHHLPPVKYNIETKSTPEGDDINHPKPAVFAKMVYDLIKQKGVINKCIIQSFDPRTLQEIRKIDPNITTALLVANIKGLQGNLKLLGFNPTIYSPEYMLVNKKLIRQCHHLNILVLPWTVNDEKKMIELKAMGVDGLISDYPDREIKVLR
jgi:glycerophosphoryl diester phosphodiesterase